MSKSSKQEILKLLAAHCPSFIDLLKSDLDTEITRLINITDTEQMRRSQGRAQYLQTLLEDIDKARRA